jgi:hypothetical protein
LLEIARVAVVLASDASSFMTASILNVDGGHTVTIHGRIIMVAEKLEPSSVVCMTTLYDSTGYRLSTELFKGVNLWNFVV